MEWFQDEKWRTHFGFAQHIKELLSQYEELTRNLDDHKRYDVTLALCCLHALLVNLKELGDEVIKQRRDWFDRPVSDVPGTWGIRRSHLIQYDFCDSPPTYKKVLMRLRNAISHPSSSHSLKTLTTGYSTISEGSLICKIRFVHAPLTNNQGRPLPERDRRRLEREFDQGKPENVDLIEGSKGFYLKRDGVDFLPFMECVIPVESLFRLAKELAILMSAPVEDADERFDVPRATGRSAR